MRLFTVVKLHHNNINFLYITGELPPFYYQPCINMSYVNTNTGISNPTTIDNQRKQSSFKRTPTVSRTAELLFGTSIGTNTGSAGGSNHRTVHRSFSFDSLDQSQSSSPFHHRHYHHHNRTNDHNDHQYDARIYPNTDRNITVLVPPHQTYYYYRTILHYIDMVRNFFFGFMYEEMDNEDSIDNYHVSSSSPFSDTTGIATFNNTYYWTNLQFLSVAIPLGISLAIQSIATSMMALLYSSIASEMIPTHLTNTSTNQLSSVTTVSFVQQIAFTSIFGTAIGKFCNGPIIDIYGARRTSVLYTLLLCTLFIVLGAITLTTTTTGTPSLNLIYMIAFCIEFLASVQWPCTIVILATHFRGNNNTTRQNIDIIDDNINTTMAGWYEGSIFFTSLFNRFGSMVGIYISSYLLRYDIHWRTIVFVAAWILLISSSIMYLYVYDSKQYKNQPQNPIDPNLYMKWFPDETIRKKRWTINRSLRLCIFVIHTNVIPSLRHILSSGTFWIVTLSHTGTSMVRTSQRLLGSYFFITSDGTLSYEQAVSYSIWHSIGTVSGLFIAGTIFTSRRNDRERKYLVSRLYVLAIFACYILSILSIPSIRSLIQAPDLIRIIQVMAVTATGFGIAVQLYHIPSLVGATFGCDKGIFLAYTDGVAYLFVALAWRYVGHTMQLHNNETYHSYGGNGGGWAYGWAAVALLLILSAILMVEFMEHYFCRPKYGSGSGGVYETIIFA
jgi:MFS family permease